MRRIFAFFPFVLCLSCVNTCDVNEFQSRANGLCCPLCPAGKHLIKACDQDYSTECQACPANHFTAIANNYSSCAKCAIVKCDSASGRILKQCTSTSNSRCECPKEKYWNSDTLRCKDCKKCDPGEQAASPCKTNEDTKCEKCPEGTYSANSTCVTCSHCQQGQMVESVCTTMKDTVCRNTSPHSQKIKMPTPANLTPDPGLHNITRTTGSRSRIEQGNLTYYNPPACNKFVTSWRDDVSKVPHSCEPHTFSDGVAWALLVLVILLCCILLLVTWSKGKKFIIKQKTPTPPAGKVPIIAKPKSSELAIRENNVKFSSLPASVTEDLATHLNAKQGQNWKHLAGKMKYNSLFTQNLDLTPTEATQKLLQDWEQKSGTTVFVLYRLLKELKRDDAAAVLLPYLTTPKSRGEVDV